MERIGTGFDGIDEALGGLITGDNVAWLCDSVDLYRRLAAGLVGDVARLGGHGLHVTFRPNETSPPGQVTTIDASARTHVGRARPLVDELERRVTSDRPSCLIVDDLTPLVRRWGLDAVRSFFEQVCPAMLEAGVTAYWQVGTALGPSFIEHVRQITQCLLDVRHGRLRVLKAEGRPDALQQISYQLRTVDDRIEIVAPPAGGRLARGLSAVRGELGMSQHELAAAAGVTPSAISQAESGSRGLSLDTVVTLSDRLGISVDRLLSSDGPRSYRLTRHDRARTVPNTTITALAADESAGLRAFLVDLAGGGRSTPPFDHRGVSLVAPIRGLLQVELDDDRPVLRSGDALVVERGPIRAWRNLRDSPASCYWVARD